MTSQVIVHLGENVILAVVVVSLVLTGHEVAGGFALAALIVNTVFVSFRPFRPTTPEAK